MVSLGFLSFPLLALHCWMCGAYTAISLSNLGYIPLAALAHFIHLCWTLYRFRSGAG